MVDEAGELSLEIGDFPVQHLAFASATRYRQGTLEIDREALVAAIAEPQAMADIDVHLAHPGESCRIVHVLDALQPMVKAAGRSTVYPGHFGPAIPAGDGRTHRLSGLALLVSAQFPESASGATIAKECERIGLPTVLATCLYTVATRVGANRIVRGGRFHHPFGKPELSPADEYAWRRKFVERIVTALCTPVQQPTVFDVEEETLVTP